MRAWQKSELVSTFSLVNKIPTHMNWNLHTRELNLKSHIKRENVRNCRKNLHFSVNFSPADFHTNLIWMWSHKKKILKCVHLYANKSGKASESGRVIIHQILVYIYFLLAFIFCYSFNSAFTISQIRFCTYTNLGWGRGRGHRRVIQSVRDCENWVWDPLIGHQAWSTMTQQPWISDFLKF